jgi:hypothetical protein
LLKSGWRSFKNDFGQLEESLSMTKDEVDAEIKLASEQAADNSRWQQRIEFAESREHRIRHAGEMIESREHRIRHVNEIEENKLHRSEQTAVLVQTNTMLVQNHVNEDGNDNPNSVIQIRVNKIHKCIRTSQDQIVGKSLVVRLYMELANCAKETLRWDRIVVLRAPEVFRVGK